MDSCSNVKPVCYTNKGDDVEDGRKENEDTPVADEHTLLLSATANAIPIDTSQTKLGKTKPISIFRSDSTNSDATSDVPSRPPSSRAQEVHRQSSSEVSQHQQAQEQKQQNLMLSWSIGDIIMEAMSNYDADSADDETGDEYPIVAHGSSLSSAVQSKIAGIPATEEAALDNNVDIVVSPGHSNKQQRHLGHFFQD